MNQEVPVSQTQPVNTPPQVPPKKKTSLIGPIITIFIFIFIIAGGVYLYRNFRDSSLVDRLFRRDNNIEEGDDSEPEEYINSEYSFSVSYPPDVEMREDAEGFVYLQKMGPSQKEGTELYDGLSLTITPGRLSGRSIKEVAEDKIAEFARDGNISVTKQPELTSVGDKTAYIFEAEGLGSFRYIYLPVGPDNYVEIVDASQDPADEGYRSMVDSIINSLEYRGPSLSS